MKASENKKILELANAEVSKGNYNGFLNYCTDDTTWNFLGDRVLHGKEEVSHWMNESYIEPPKNNVTNLLCEGDYVIATGVISMKEKDGTWSDSDYCDVWRVEGDKLAELRAYVIKSE